MTMLHRLAHRLVALLALTLAAAGPAAIMTASTAAATTASPAASPASTTSVHGVRLALPRGWKVIEHHRDDMGPENFGFDIYCLGTSTRPAESCGVALIGINRPTGTQQRGYAGFDVDREGFGIGNPPQYRCGNGFDSVQEIARDSTFGGRAADYRSWVRSCHGAVVAREAQYVSPYAPGWGLFVENPDRAHTAADFAAFHFIAAHSTLPKATSGRLMDRGVIRSVTSGAKGFTIALDRVYSTRQGQRTVYVNRSAATYRYVVPTALWRSAHVHTGERVYLTTDGRTVTSLLPS